MIDETWGWALTKFASLWAVIGITTWADAGQRLAVIYGVLLIVHQLIKIRKDLKNE